MPKVKDIFSKLNGFGGQLSSYPFGQVFDT